MTKKPIKETIHAKGFDMCDTGDQGTDTGDGSVS
jgi:hypothetical protein